MQHLVVLDGLRGIAALAVLCLHMPEFFGTELFYSAHLAVDFFFMLSGFVITHAYGKRLACGMSIAEFIKQRLIRLYPLYLLALAIAAPAEIYQAIRGQEREAAAALNFGTAVLFLPSPITTDLFPLNPPAWSLFDELAVNLIFAFGLYRLPTRPLMVVVFGSAICLWIAATLHLLGFGREHVGPLADHHRPPAQGQHR